MALFTEKGGAGGDAVTGLSIIGAGMRVVGDISADGVVKIEGTVVGTVRAGRQVLVGKGGEVEGDVISREAIIGGEVRGSVRADERESVALVLEQRGRTVRFVAEPHEIVTILVT